MNNLLKISNQLNVPIKGFLSGNGSKNGRKTKTPAGAGAINRKKKPENCR